MGEGDKKAPQSNYYSMPGEGVLTTLGSKITGLSKQEAEERLKEYGENKLTVESKISPLSIFINQFKNTLTIILLIATTLILFIYFFGERDQTDLIEAGLIFGIVILIAVLGFVQEFKAEKAVEALKKLLAFKAVVRRDGAEMEIDVEKLVPGDIILLEEGKRVPADIRLIEVSQLQTNEASLTGESVPITKNTAPINETVQINDQKNMVFSGTTVVYGRGVGVVVATGNRTEIGKIAKSVAEIKEETTPLQKRLESIGQKLGYIVVGICSIVFIFIMFFAEEFTVLPLLSRVIHSFIASVALAVAAIPEGLPAVVTISLALGTQRMLRKKALVKKLNSVETLGSTDVICSDKTGTLTKGEMTVREIFTNSELVTVSGSGYEQVGEFRAGDKAVDTKSLSLLLACGAQCNNAAVTDDGKNLGDPTELALLVSAGKAGLKKGAERVFEIPFNSERKMMTVVIKEADKYTVYSKGAPEVLLSHCAGFYSEGSTTPIGDDQKKLVLNETHKMSEKALRTLGFAYKEISEAELVSVKENPATLEENLIFIGLQGMDDPPREEVKDLIALCHTSGIRVIMITGDHVETAKAIAKEIGIVGDSITGIEFAKLSEEQLRETIKSVNIYARVNPEDKLAIVTSLKKEDHVVAMTGDGVNDAPALKKADIGIAMGITGTDVAKEASDVVLLDDHFATIVKSVEEGRGIYQNITKFVHYLLACNIAEVMIVLASVFLLRELPFTATMLLWVNVVTDGLPALALALDPPPASIMKSKPSDFQKEIIDLRGWISMTIFAVIVTICVLGVYVINLPQGRLEASSAAFMALVMFEIVKVFLVRTASGTRFFANPLLLITILGTIGLQISIAFIPITAKLFSVEHIDIFDWTLILVLAGGIWGTSLFIQTIFPAVKKS